MPDVKSFVISLFSLLKNWFGFMLFSLILLLIIDCLTGFIAAIKNGQLSSGKMRSGLFKKFVAMALLLVTMLVDSFLGKLINGFFSLNIKSPLFFTVLFLIYMMIMEIVSIIENLIKIGVPVPEFIKKHFDNNNTRS
jgi:toxin secretion/phage lysis holin